MVTTPHHPRSHYIHPKYEKTTISEILGFPPWLPDYLHVSCLETGSANHNSKRQLFNSCLCCTIYITFARIQGHQIFSPSTPPVNPIISTTALLFIYITSTILTSASGAPIHPRVEILSEWRQSFSKDRQTQCHAGMRLQPPLGYSNSENTPSVVLRLF